MSEGVGEAATAYGSTKERLYHDLDFNKYEFLPFIVETTGGWSKGAYNFCKELKKRHESSIYTSDSHYRLSYETNTLQSTISIELQRANSRMILERTPVSEDLIESAMVKCELAVKKKKQMAIESLRLESLRPARIQNHSSIPMCMDLVEATIEESIICESKNVGKKSVGKEGMRESKSEVAVVRWDGDKIMGKASNKQDPLPKEQNPPDECGKLSSRSNKAESMEEKAGERSLAPKLSKSQNSSTSAAAVRKHSNLATAQKNEQRHNRLDWRVIGSSKVITKGKDVDKVHWDPPPKRKLHLE